MHGIGADFMSRMAYVFLILYSTLSAGAAIQIECIVLMTKFDKSEGFKEADRFMTNDAFCLNSKARLSIGLMKYGYTGGHWMLKEILLKNSSFPVLFVFYLKIPPVHRDLYLQDAAV